MYASISSCGRVVINKQQTSAMARRQRQVNSSLFVCKASGKLLASFVCLYVIIAFACHSRCLLSNALSGEPAASSGVGHSSYQVWRASSLPTAGQLSRSNKNLRFHKSVKFKKSSLNDRNTDDDENDNDETESNSLSQEHLKRTRASASLLSPLPTPESLISVDDASTARNADHHSRLSDYSGFHHISARQATQPANFWSKAESLILQQAASNNRQQSEGKLVCFVYFGI